MIGVIIQELADHNSKAERKDGFACSSDSYFPHDLRER